jgi:hypothetical protein
MSSLSWYVIITSTSLTNNVDDALNTYKFDVLYSMITGGDINMCDSTPLIGDR